MMEAPTASVAEVRELVAKTLEAHGVMGSLKVRLSCATAPVQGVDATRAVVAAAGRLMPVPAAPSRCRCCGVCRRRFARQY